jgi:arsenate reductase (thioredoxin)
MAEAYLNHIGGSRWAAHSAGSRPTGRVNPAALGALRAAGIPAPSEPRSKSWDEFAVTGAPGIDLVITVCDNAANEACPHFAGTYKRVHLPFPDPALVEGTDGEMLAAFSACLSAMRPKLDQLLAALNVSVT